MSSSAETATTPLEILQQGAATVNTPLEILQQGAASEPFKILTQASAAPGLEELTKIYVDNFYWNLIYLIILTVVLIAVLFNVFIGGIFGNIIKNWPQYRCNPLVMPFAGLFGYDSTENFNFCMKSIFSSNAAAVLGPVYGLMSKFTDIAGTISNAANSFRYLIANLMNGMERLMNSYRDRFQFLIFQIRMSFMKMLSLLGKLYGTFYAIIFMGLSGLGAANNVANNDLVKFLLEFCFDPDTPIELADGSVKKLSDLVVGDVLKAVDGKTPKITSLFRFDGSKTPMVKIGSVHVSKQHFTFYNDDWIKAEDHPDAVEAESIPELVCLNTDTHVLTLDGLIFSDYDESSDSSVVETTQALAEMRLNAGLFDEMIEKTKDYELGLDGDLGVVFKDGSVKSIRDVKIGDELLGGGTVLGLIKESCKWTTTLPNGLHVSSSQLLWDKDFTLWRRAAFVYPDNTKLNESPMALYQLSVSNNTIESVDYLFRDYREINDPDMEEAYENKLTKKMNTGFKNKIM